MRFKSWLLSESSDLEIGRIIEIPEKGTRYAFNAQIIKVAGDTVWLRRVTPGKASPIEDDMAGGVPFKMSRSAVRHFINDLHGVVSVNGATNDPYIKKVLDGSAKYLGKGDDGVVFDAGDMVVKVSTTVPFHPDAGNHRSVSAAARALFSNSNLTEKLRKSGVPGILPTYAKVVGDKVFVVMPKVEIGNMSREQIKELKVSVEAIHKAGYVINDEIQAGVWQGKAYHYDLGKLAKISHKDDVKDDMGRFNHFSEEHGFIDPMGKWEYYLNMLTYWHTDNDEARRKYIRKLISQKVLVDKEYPERKVETEEEFERVVDD
jgi:hypothetical protein